MALFTVNRYLGTEDASLKPEPNKASLILERIKADAEKRRQERGLPQPKDTSNERKKSNDKEVLTKTTSKSTENTDKDVSESKPRTKKRRRKRDEEPTSVHSPGKQKKAKPNEDTEKSSKRKRHKLQNAETEERNSPETVSMELGEVLPVDLSEEMKKRLADMSVKSSDYEEEVDENDVNVAPEKDGPHEIGGYTVLGDFKPKHIEKVKRVLPDWLASPNVVSADISHDQTPLSHVTGLHPVILEKLKQNGITTFFPVQAQVIPAMLSSLHQGYHVGPGGYRPSDICCSAPTGSGKTLAFVLPIIQALLGRVVCQIRALVILPVQDLARQVYGVFHTYCHGTNIKVGLIIGQKSFQSEQQALVRKRLRGFQSQVDVVVATPGRLVDHINKTDGFDLRHLRFLVIDEADRMMSEVNQDWLTQVERAVHAPKCGHGLYPEFVRPQPGHITVAETAQLTMPVQKLLFSATLSQNPERLQQLRLFQPKLFTSVVKKQTMHAVGTTDGDHNHDHSSIGDTLESNRADFIGKYTTPVGLTEYFVESFTAEKPLVVLYFLSKLSYRQVLCFTNSVESTHRLYLLARLAGGFEVREFSSKLHATKRKRILEQFKSGKIDLLICSDAMARGMDVENVKYVVSYDSPLFIKTYIHRVGRTARAGKTGTALTLLERKEVFHFKKMLREAGKTDIRELKVGRADLEPLVPIYQEALQQLPDAIKNEKRKSSS